MKKYLVIKITVISICRNDKKDVNIHIHVIRIRLLVVRKRTAYFVALRRKETENILKQQ